jgi:Putative peptidoglycan binding domain
MKNKKNLLRMSIALIIFNLFLGGVLFVTQFVNQTKYDEQSNSVSKNSQEVLGINTNIPQFSPNYVMSNSTFSSTRVFSSAQSVQNYLNQVNSPLAKYEENGQKASYWIFAASQGTTSSQYGVTPKINPGVILAYLEKEQSLLSLTGYDTQKDPENRIKTAMGYGCPDTSNCDPQYKGFANQVKWAAYQLQYNYNNANNQNFSHVVNKTITTLDGYNVFLSNEATASNYRYTPHVYWGNYNLWKIITSNGWGVDSSTWNPDDIDRVNIAKIDTTEGFDTDKLKPENMTTLLNKSFNIGDSGGEIILLQRFLRQQGYFTYSEITGTFGNITKNALENYKKDKGISAPAAGVNCNDLYAKNWSIGQTSDEVKALQECLRKDGAFDYPISTGYFGPVTQASLEKIRSKNGQPAPQPAPAPQPVANSCDTLKNQAWKFGDRNDSVKALQQCMRQAGIFSYPDNTGYFGPLTQEAFNKWKGVNQASNVAKSQTCDQIKTQSFDYGEKSDRVKALQQCMKDAGFFKWPYITGYFGSVTQVSYSQWKGRNVPQIDCSELKGNEWQLGEQSDRVKQLQGCMRQAGTFKFGSDTGYFGEITKQALIKWRGYF